METAEVPTGRWDVIVVGAGIYGLPVAFFLASMRGARVLVIEDNAIPGDCITVNTGGIIRIAYSQVDVARVAAFARRIYTRPTATLRLKRPVRLGFIPSGWGRFVNVEHDPGIVREITRIAEAAGEGLSVQSKNSYLESLSQARRENLARIIDLNDFTHVLVDDDGGYADGGTALVGFYEACLEVGVAVSRYSTVTEFVKNGERIVGVVFDRWSHRDGQRMVLSRHSVEAERIVLAAGASNGELVRRAAGWEMPTFKSFHQLPFIRNTADLGLQLAAYGVGEPGSATGSVEAVDAPVVSHWRDIYFRPEGNGLVFGVHHQELQPNDYRPRGGVVDAGTFKMQVGLDQVMVDKLLELMPHFPALSSNGVNLGKSPGDIAGGAYYMNPEELPFEGEVPGTDGSLFYAGSGCGTGFKLGPGVAYLLVQRLIGVPRESRLIASTILSAERAQYFYPPGTSLQELKHLFRPIAAGGRLIDMGAAGITTGLSDIDVSKS